jgi:mannose-6-phosphate isomerase-like protein (cupin superfamily)
MGTAYGGHGAECRAQHAELKEETMTKFEAKHLPMERSAVAPDGSDVRILLGLDAGGMAHFELAPDKVSRAVTHRTVEEIWYFVSGRGQMWRKQNDLATVVDVYPGVCLTIPLGTHFQFRCFGYEPLAAIGVTLPPWPGESEAITVEGEWKATVV